MRIGDPVPTDQVHLRDRDRITSELRDRVASMLEEQPIHA
jgi:hypothetical protein